MPGLMSADDIFDKVRDAAVAATGPDEKALQIDYDALKQKIRAALGDRKVARCHINKFLPEGYEEQGRFNAVLLTAGNVIFDMVIGDSYFRYDIVSVGQLDKVQIIDAALGQPREAPRGTFPQPPPHARRGNPSSAGARRRGAGQPAGLHQRRHQRAEPGKVDETCFTT